jgi:hypothetical protein
MTVKLAYALRQRPNLTTEEFQKLWRDNHGPLVASFQTVLNLVKYVQAHRLHCEIDDSLRRSREMLCTKEEAPFDIFDEYYFEGSMQKFIANLHSEEGKRAWDTLRKDEEKYIDFRGSQMFFVQELPQILPGPHDNLIASEFNHTFRAVALAEMSEGGFDYWLNSHASLTRRWATVMGYEKYVQNHPYQASVLADLRKERGMPAVARYSWYTNIWVNSRVAYDVKYQEGMMIIRKDEDSGFMKPGSMSCFLAKEQFLVDKYRY